jgi:hypothetical protein
MEHKFKIKNSLHEWDVIFCSSITNAKLNKMYLFSLTIIAGRKSSENISERKPEKFSS